MKNKKLKLKNIYMSSQTLSYLATEPLKHKELVEVTSFSFTLKLHFV
jgi:hypothetical protein